MGDTMEQMLAQLIESDKKHKENLEIYNKTLAENQQAILAILNKMGVKSRTIEMNFEKAHQPVDEPAEKMESTDDDCQVVNDDMDKGDGELASTILVQVEEHNQAEGEKILELTESLAKLEKPPAASTDCDISNVETTQADFSAQMREYSCDPDLSAIGDGRLSPEEKHENGLQDLGFRLKGKVIQVYAPLGCAVSDEHSGFEVFDPGTFSVTCYLPSYCGNVFVSYPFTRVLKHVFFIFSNDIQHAKMCTTSDGRGALNEHVGGGRCLMDILEEALVSWTYSCT